MEIEQLQTDLTTWEIGPYHGALPGAMRMKLRLDGEIIVSGETESGFLHRGLEKAFELHPWQATVSYADRLDPECAIFGELALCLAVEEITGLEVPARAQMIRVTLSELGRISGHLLYLVRMAKAVGSETMMHFVLRDREKVLDLFELLTGARFTHNFLRFGGVREDVTEGFIERVIEVCDLIRIRLKEYNDLFTYNQAFLKRSRGVGLIDRSMVLKYGLTGPNARASGIQMDVRRAHPYIGFDRLDFEVPALPLGAERGGDVHERLLVRLREIAQSVEILKQIGEKIPSGGFGGAKVGNDFEVPAGEAYSRIESSRGLLGCYVVSGGLKPSRVQFRVPSLSTLEIVPELIVGIRIEDLPVVLASLDIGIAEADR